MESITLFTKLQKRKMENIIIFFPIVECMYIFHLKNFQNGIIDGLREVSAGKKPNGDIYRMTHYRNSTQIVCDLLVATKECGHAKELKLRHYFQSPT